GDQDFPALGDGGRHAHRRRDLVVEAGDGQRSVAVVATCVEQHTTKHRDGRSSGQALGYPGNGIGEVVTLDADLHASPFPDSRDRSAQRTSCTTGGSPANGAPSARTFNGRTSRPPPSPRAPKLEFGESSEVVHRKARALPILGSFPNRREIPS